MRWIWVGALTVAAAAAAGVLAIAHGGGSGGAAPVSRTGVATSLDHTAVDFADPVTATVTVFAARGAPVRVRQDLAPLTQLGTTRVTRITRGSSQTVTYVMRASCLDEQCITQVGAKRITLRPAVVDVAGASTTADWPVLKVQPRVAPADAALARPPMRADASPPALTYRAAPRRLAVVLDVAAAVLAAAGVLLAGATAAALYRARRKPAPLSALASALALAREAERRPPPDRRRALGLLARVLGPRDRRLADEAEQLAWSAPAPTPAAVSNLVTEVEKKANGR